LQHGLLHLCTCLLLLLQVDLLLLIPLRIITGIILASCYVTVGGFSHPWLRAMGTECLSYCISVIIDYHHRSIYKKLWADEAAFAANAAAGAAGSKAAVKPKQLGAQNACTSGGWMGVPLQCAGTAFGTVRSKAQYAVQAYQTSCTFPLIAGVVSLQHLYFPLLLGGSHPHATLEAAAEAAAIAAAASAAAISVALKFPGGIPRAESHSSPL